MPRPTLLAPTVVALLVVGLPTACTASPAPRPTPAASPTATATPTSGEPLLTDDIADDTAVGTLAPGFPSTLVPVPPAAEVLVSSAESLDDGRLRISLNVRTVQETPALLEAIRGPLLAAGFAESAPTAVEPGLAAQTTFSRSGGTELLVLGVLDRDGVRTMTLGGTVAVPAP